MNSNTNYSLSSWNYGAYSNSNPYFHQGVRPISAQYQQPNMPKTSNYNYNKFGKRILPEEERIVTNDYMSTINQMKKMKQYELDKQKKKRKNKNIQKEKEKDKIEIGKLCSGFIDNKLVTIIDDKLYYNGLEYNKYTGRYIKKEYKKENIIQFKCKNHRKDERHRKGLGNFCNSEIILQISNQNNITDQKFIMIKAHREEFKN